MADLIPHIHTLCDRPVRKVDELHDDYFRTNQLWLELLVRQRYGDRALSVQNAKTGSLVSGPSAWADRARDSQLRLRVRTFKDLASQVELFLDSLLRLWLNEFPRAAEGKSITLVEILAAADLADVRARATAEAVESTILDKLKAKPKAWFGYLRKHLGCTTGDAEVARFAERKAARDVLEHHDGLVDPSYVDKSAGVALYTAGELIEPDDAAIDALYDMVRGLIIQIAADAERHFQTASGTRAS